MSVSALKLLGLCSMLWDHLCCIFPPRYLFPGLGELPLRLLPYFGRLAAPIFLYSLVSGFRHTGSRTRYAARLLVFGLLSQLPYLLLFCGQNHRYGQPLPAPGEVGYNILFTLLLGLGMLELAERWGKSCPPAAFLAVLGCMGLARLLDLEGREGYLLIILALYHLTDGRRRPRWLEAAVLLLAAVLARWRLILLAAELGKLHPTVLLNILGPFLGLCLAFFCCNGQKGRASKRARWGMYLFYPLHLLVLGGLGMVLPLLG